MERVNKIFFHPLYQRHFQELQKAEEERIFCNHTMEHFLDVARLMMIRNLQEQAGLDAEVIYAVALLHDLGRNLQYREGISHEIASAQLAKEILPDCGYTAMEQEQIIPAILSHRQDGTEERLAAYLYEADKKSRNCFVCKAFAECNWAKEKKNMEILG